IQTWINQGAETPTEEIPGDPRDHWAFRTLVRPELPPVSNTTWTRNSIDNFIADQHEQIGLTPQAEAEPIVLLRRLYFDLIGVPPPAEEVLAIQQSPESGWYERKVDELLEDPRYGERWARHWMDVWRYSDWSGFNGQLRNSQKHIWHWRDWIIESLNADKPYDEMVRLMMAADELHPNDLDQLRATGYLARNWTIFNRTEWMDNVVEHVSKGFLGLTTNCAKCHEHKFDPISQQDYYAMRAFFEPYHVRLDIAPGQSDVNIDAIPRVFDGMVDEPTYLLIRGDERNPDKSKVIEPNVPELFRFSEFAIEPVDLPVESWQPERREWVIQAYVTQAQIKIDESAAKVKSLTEKSEANDNQSGEESQLKLQVAHAALKLAEAELISLQCRAKALQAGWKAGNTETGILKDATDKELARAAIQAEREVKVARARKEIADAENNFYHAKEDKQQEAKSKLDKAHESLEKELKQLSEPIHNHYRYALLSGAKWTPTRFTVSTKDDAEVGFAPRSTGRRTMLAKWITDPQNPLTARVAVNHIWARHMGSPLHSSVFDFGLKSAPPVNPKLLDWLASELIDSGWSMKHIHRLIVMSATYRQSSSTRGVEGNIEKDQDNLYWWHRQPIRLESEVVRDSVLAHAGKLDDTMGGPPVESEQQASSTRRSIYFFHSADSRDRFLANFNSADVGECYRRESSIQPQQALALNNSKLVLESASSIVAQLSTVDDEDTTFVQTAFAVLLGIEANDEEIKASLNALEAWKQEAGNSTLEARSHFIWTLINHNDFVTLR
ncbi:MAG: DUF1553 domain-containing protein, partial [Planctomycetaceae bacterium]|nr:DUF1553 domain-containing protein [Planctomycetaceae bacterium]